MLYLASASLRRAKLLKEAGVRFEVLKSDYHERNFDRSRPSQLVKRHALGKALAAARKVKNGKILGADSIVYCRGKIVGKPGNLREAMKMLAALQGRWQTVYTGVAFLEIRQSRVLRQRLFYEKTKVLLNKMEKKDIRRYFRRVNPLDKAGACAIQASGPGIVREVVGSFSNAVGLPMERLRFL